MYYMWAASMVENCTMGEWETNSEVVLARSDGPLGPFERLKTVVEPWAHNPQTIRAPDSSSTSGFVYAVFTMGDGMDCEAAGTRTHTHTTPPPLLPPCPHAKVTPSCPPL